jgi:hypothetical protein
MINILHQNLIVTVVTGNKTKDVNFSYSQHNNKLNSSRNKWQIKVNTHQINKYWHNHNRYRFV